MSLYYIVEATDKGIVMRVIIMDNNASSKFDMHKYEYAMLQLF